MSKAVFSSGISKLDSYIGGFLFGDVVLWMTEKQNSIEPLFRACSDYCAAHGITVSGLLPPACPPSAGKLAGRQAGKRLGFLKSDSVETFQPQHTGKGKSAFLRKTRSYVNHLPRNSLLFLDDLSIWSSAFRSNTSLLQFFDICIKTAKDRNISIVVSAQRSGLSEKTILELQEKASVVLDAIGREEELFVVPVKTNQRYVPYRMFPLRLDLQNLNSRKGSQVAFQNEEEVQQESERAFERIRSDIFSSDQRFSNLFNGSFEPMALFHRSSGFREFNNGSFLDISGVIRFNNLTDKESETPPDTFTSMPYRTSGDYSLSGTEIELNARTKLKISEKVNFIPYGRFKTISAKPKEDAPPLLRTLEARYQLSMSNKVSLVSLALGIGGEFKTQTTYIAGGVSWMYARSKTEGSRNATDRRTPTTMYDSTSSWIVTNTYTAIPVVNLGAEWWLTDWLAGRVGYYRSIGNLNGKYENNDVYVSQSGSTVTTRSYSSTNEYNNDYSNSFVAIGGLTPLNNDGLVTLGLGFKFGGFALDATVSEEALRRGLGLFGASDNINTFGYMTASYSFSE